MKTSIIFITLLFAVSCNIQNPSEAAFVQLTKDPRAEAVLATVAIQMQANNGFEKVQSLLGELLNTARDNLHNNNMLNRKATARCEVYNHKLSERSEYLASVVESLNAERGTVEEARANAGEAIKARAALRTSYAGLKTAEAKRFASENNFYTGLKNTINEALTAVTEIEGRLKGNAPNPAFVQTGIKKITESYAHVFNVKIDLPESFIQTSIDNDAAKKRILQWLADIRVTFTSMVGAIGEDAKTRNDNNTKFEALLEKIVENLATENGNIAKLQAKYTTLMGSYQDNITAFGNFVAKNKENLAENTAWCAAEAAAYERVKSNSESNVRIYEELMNYFLQNYRKISKMINDKYKVIA